jgi:Ni/Co efflux regulator RcnB
MKLSFFATALLALSSTLGMAQTSATIAQRKVNQQDRIAQGVRSGQLTAGETHRVEGREASINREEHNMRRADDGHLTRGDRAALNARQNRTSRAIYRDKHNAARR